MRHVTALATVLALSCLAPAGCGTPTGTSAAPNPAGPTGLNPGAAASPSAAMPAPAPAAPPSVPPVCIKNGAQSINLTVEASAGPHGAPAPLPINNNLYSMNIFDQARADYVPQASNAYVAYLKALRPGMLRWPAGFYGQQYQFTSSGPEGPFNMTPALIDAYMRLCQQTGAQPYISVNVETGTVQNAADLVRYVNITKGYKAVWWQLGNEPDLQGVDATHSPQLYATTYLKFAAAMKAVDPTIKLVGAELLSGEDCLGQHGNVDWLTPILQIAGSQMDAVAWHYYPIDSDNPNTPSSAGPSVAHLLNEDAQDWPPAGMDFVDTIFPGMKSKLQTYAPQAQIWVDEFAEDSGAQNGANLSDQDVGALWAADALGRFAEYGPGALFKFIYKAEPTHKYTLIDNNEAPRPEYYAYWMYAQLWGDRLVKSTSDAPAEVNVHAALRSGDGSLRVMVVNKHSTAEAVRLQIAGYTPSAAQSYVLQGDGYVSTNITLNGTTLSMSNIGLGEKAIAPAAAQACTDNVMTLPAYSVTLLVFHPAIP
jgi:hypothetical protein